MSANDILKNVNMKNETIGNILFIEFPFLSFQLNLREMFTTDADFSELFESEKPIHVSDVVHRAFIEVTEDGSKAAAASGTTILP